jgi:hypothetical protein
MTKAVLFFHWTHDGKITGITGRAAMPQSATDATDPERRALETLARQESLILSERDRAAFFDALVHPPKPNARLRRAVRLAKERVSA